MSPEAYRGVLDGLEIISIAVDSFAGKVVSRERLEARHEKRVVTVKEDSSMSAGTPVGVTMWHSYDLVVVDHDTEEAPKLMTLSVRFRVDYASKMPVTKEFFEQFRQVSLPLQVAPFARAWIHDHCLRIGVQPLIMPLVRAK